jgi:hypothetical protein
MLFSALKIISWKAITRCLKFLCLYSAAIGDPISIYSSCHISGTVHVNVGSAHLKGARCKVRSSRHITIVIFKMGQKMYNGL